VPNHALSIKNDSLPSKESVAFYMSLLMITCNSLFFAIEEVIIIFCAVRDYQGIPFCLWSNQGDLISLDFFRCPLDETTGVL